MSDYTINENLDITCDVCPITFVKAKLKLEEMKSGEILEIILNDGEPVQNVPRTIKEQGHKILLLEKVDDKYRILVERG